MKEHRDKSKSHFSSMVDNARKQYGSEDDMDGLNGRFDTLSVSESTECESVAGTSTSDHNRRHGKSKSRDHRNSGHHRRHHHSASKSSDHHRKSASKSGNHHRQSNSGHHHHSGSKSDDHRGRSASKRGDSHRKSASKSGNHHRGQSASKRGDYHDNFESDEEVWSSSSENRCDNFESDEEGLSSSSKKYRGDSSDSHRFNTKRGNNGHRSKSNHGQRTTSKSGSCRHHDASSGRRDRGSDRRRDPSPSEPKSDIDGAITTSDSRCGIYSGDESSSKHNSFNSCNDIDRILDFPMNIDVTLSRDEDAADTPPPMTPGTKGSKGSIIDQIGTLAGRFLLGTPLDFSAAKSTEESGEGQVKSGSPSDFSRVTERTSTKNQTETNHSGYRLRSRTTRRQREESKQDP